MKINFKSTILQNGETKEFDFTAPVDIDRYEDMDTFSFTEPTQNVANRIEISHKKINIFAGPTTLFIEKDKNLASPFILNTPDGKVMEVNFYTRLLNLEIDPLNKYKFEYILYHLNDYQEDVIGNFKIELTIS
ncbi:hypothetical protein MSGX11T_00814 [Mycoplasma synoviae GX11-T]|nr:hypothetical protein [Mycoplasmopsis synoviae]MBD5788557.1 hypothetical protein [Mycoplasmopsis synoviae GX11-T]